MKMRFIAPLAITVTAAAIGFAPIAAAAPTASTPNPAPAPNGGTPKPAAAPNGGTPKPAAAPNGGTPNPDRATVVQSPGNVQITAHLGKAAQEVGLAPTDGAEFRHSP